MAITDAAVLESGDDTTSTDTYTTGSFTPTGGAKLYLHIIARSSGAGGQSISTLTGNGITWTFVNSEKVSLDTQTMQEVWEARVPSIPTTGALTITFDVTVTFGVAWNVIEFIGATGTAVQSTSIYQGSVADDAFITDTLASFGDATNNAVVVAVGALSGDVGEIFTHEAGYTEIVESESLSDALHIGLAWKIGEDLSPSYQNTRGASMNMSLISFEVEAVDSSLASNARMMMGVG